LFIFLIIVSPSGFVLGAEEDQVKTISFYRDIRPIFQANCQGCHQPSKARGKYIMTDFEKLIQGGESGESAIIPGDPQNSYLVEVITPIDGEAEMPQKADPLHETEIALINKWVLQGAKDDTPEGAKQKFTAENPPEYIQPPVVTALDYSPDGSLLAVSGFHEVLLNEADGSAIESRLVGLSERIESISFSPDGKKIAVTGGLPARMGELQVWNTDTRKLSISVPVTYDTIYGGSWSPDGSIIAFGCSDTTVRAVDAKSGKQVLFMGSHNDWVIDTVFSVKGDYLSSVGRDMSAKLTKVDEQRFIDNITSITPKALKGGILTVTRHPTKDHILFGGADGVPKIYRMQRVKKREIGDDSNQLWNLPPLKGRIFSVDWSNDGKLIAAGSSLDGKGYLHIYGINPEYQVPGDIDGIIKKPVQNRNGGEKNKLNDYFKNGIKTIAAIESIPSGVYAVAFNPDGSRIAAAGSDGLVRIFDTSNGEKIHEFVPVPISR
ncbi:MAG: c-type cytochrome domain-containing protein, partial [Verrucomicrobiota bacterium]|nr:c-type cytochrome domain-containing protein [Verrucomicrobiota bacterium]